MFTESCSDFSKWVEFAHNAKRCSKGNKNEKLLKRCGATCGQPLENILTISLNFAG